MANVARDNDQLEQLAQGLYKKLNKLTSAPGSKLSARDVTKLVQSTIELDTLPGEIAASFRSTEVNPSQTRRVMLSMDNFLKRERRALGTIEKLLKKKGALGDEELRDKLLGVLNEEVFHFMEREAKDGTAGQQLMGVFNRLIKNESKIVEVFSPHQQTLMRRVNNAYVVTGSTLRLTASQKAAVKKGKTAEPRVLLGQFEGRQAGTLEDSEIAEALTDLDRAGQRALSQDEIIRAADEMPAVQDLIRRQHELGNDVTTAEILAAMSKSGRTKTRIVPRTVTEEIPLWDSGRTRWTAMRAMLKRNPEYMQEFGPGVRKVSRPLRISAQDVAGARKALSEADAAVLAGKSTRFDEAALPTGALPNLERLRKLQGRRALPKTHSLRDQVITPAKHKVTTRVAPPRGDDEFAVFLEKEGGLIFNEEQVGQWAINYSRGRLLIREVQAALARAQKTGQRVEIDQTILADLEGSIVRDVVESHLPKEFTEMLDLSRKISAHSFEAAKRAGVWLPGSPVAYMARFFNKAGRERIKRLMGEIEEFDQGLLTRLGVKQSQYFKRQFDEMPIDDLNELQFGLRDAMTGKHASPKLREFHARLDKEMEKAGIGISGLKKALPWLKKERVENDPFLSLLQRFGVAQQDTNLQKYFDNMLDASRGENGESLMLGGKVVGVIDDTGNVHRADHSTYKLKSTKRSKVDGQELETVALREETTSTDFSPKSVLIELDDGTVHTFENSLLQETGFGLLPLGRGATEAGAGYKATTGNSFARASMRSDMHTSMFRGPLKDHEALGLMDQNVVFGNQNNILGLAKTAAQVHKVTAPALRTFDAINYGIKSFQTIFRLPFHIANLSSGVFQAHLAGATPKNLMASYWDTMRFMFGDQEFARKTSMVNDLLDVGSDAHSMGFVNVLKGEKTLLQEAARTHGGGDWARYLATQDPDAVASLDRFEDLVIPLADGTELDMREFVQLAGEMQLYGTFASSLTRGSRSVGDNLVRIKMNALEPTLGGRFLGAPKRLMTKMANLAETSEVINRTSTALALVREGHPMRRAIEIAKEAHVPYEKLTPFERNAMKRFSVYYTFPRHYMPWAWARFAEDPQKLSGISHFIRDQNVVTTQEGKPNLVVGDYRVDLGRLNANMEAAGMLGAMADRIIMPGVEAIVPKGTPLVPDSWVDQYDTRKLRSRYSDAGILNIGGVASIPFGGGSLIPDPQRDMPGRGMFEEATTLVWPLKMLSVLAGKSPSKEETTPFVDYTPFEEWLTSTVYGPGVRKVRDNHELVRAQMSFRRMLKRIQLRAAATEDPEKRARLLSHAQEMTHGIRQIASEMERKEQ